jgi:hypothetical protein
LRLVDEEVFPEDRHVDRRTDAAQRLDAPAEVVGLREDAQGRRAAGDHRLCELDRVVLARSVGRRARRFDLGDHRHAAGSRRPVEGRSEIPGLDGDAVGTRRPRLDLGRSIACGRQDRLDCRVQLRGFLH